MLTDVRRLAAHSLAPVSHIMRVNTTKGRKKRREKKIMGRLDLAWRFGTHISGTALTLSWYIFNKLDIFVKSFD